MFNTDILNNFTIGVAATVPIIVAITQALKATQWVKDKYIPFISIFIGVLVSIMFTNNFMQSLGATIMLGILYGLSASGLYSTIKVTQNAIIEEKARKASKQQAQHKSEDKRIK
jgi:hypothetical protein